MFKKKQKSLFCEAMELDRELDKTVFEAFKHLFATIECYKNAKIMKDLKDQKNLINQEDLDVVANIAVRIDNKLIFV